MNPRLPNKPDPFDRDTPAPPADWARRLLSFWFEDHDRDDWFGGSADFDADIGAIAGDWHESLRSQVPTSFLADPETALAAIILFDQVPRNLYRGHADAFATDELARAIAREVVARDWDEDWDADRRMFAYLPFEHSEDMDDQRESLRLFAKLADSEALDFAQRHFEIIESFGRFPHRNQALGRASREDERAAIEEGRSW